MNRSVYVTGTDTGVGKTLASCVLLHAIRTRGDTAVGMKPVASGCAWLEGAWCNEDATALLAASDPRPDPADLNPFALPAATAPQLAARDAGVTVSLAPVVHAYARLVQLSRTVVVEGVGGWAAPFGDGFEQADLVRVLELPVVLVVGLRLGCLSHARLTARAIQADGCHLAGWIGSAVDPDFDRCDDYLQLLRDALPAPCLGVLPHVPHADPHVLAARLDLGLLA